MPNRCCFPGCKSNYSSTEGGYVSRFQFPTDPELKEKWLKCIPRKNWTPNKTSVVCAKHFLLSDIIVVDKYTDTSGVEHVSRRIKPVLKKDACPAVFSEGLAASYRPRSKNVSVTVSVSHVEQLLLTWMTEKQRAGGSVSEAMIRKKAKLIHADLLKNKAGARQEECQVFKASYAWFVKFKKTWTDIHNVARPGEGASADEDAANDFVTKSEGFETDWTLKRMPNKTYIKQEAHSEVKQEKPEYDTDGEVHTLKDISSAFDLNKIDNYVSSHSPSHNSHTCADVEENRTVENNSHSSVCVRDNVLSDRTLNHQVITSENIKEEMCYTEDVRSGEDKNKQTQKEATESVIAVDFQAMMAGVKDGCNLNREDLLQGNNNNLEQGLSACEKTPKCQQNDANIVMCSRKYLDEIFVNKWKMKSDASQKSSQPPVLQSVQSKSVLHYDQPSVLQSDQSPVLQLVQPPILQSVQQTFILHYDQPSVLQSDQPSVLQSDQPSVLQSVQPLGLQSDQPSVLQSCKCKFCHHGFVLNSSLKEHRLVQKGILPHICSNCGRAFRLDTVLMKHTNEQTEKKADKCTQFDDRFYKSEFSDGMCQNIFTQKHKQMHTREKHYKCDVCDIGFATYSQLYMHKITHSVSKPYKCDVCDRGFATNSLLNMHKRQHSGLKPYTCGVCDRGFARNEDMKKHTRTHTGEKPYLCEVCGRGFASIYGLKMHTRTHTGEKPYKCDVCNRVFLLKGSLDIHKFTHTGKKPYKCDVCGHGFTKKYGLIIHTRTHTGDRSYNCDVCGRGFVLKDSLDIHKQTHTGKQIHTDEKLYQCDTCGLTFKHTHGLRQHTRTHIEGKSFKCDVCGCGYRSKYSFTLHIKTHRGEKPQGQCDICGKTFLYKSYLKIHKRVHTQERPYKCDVCEASFTISTTLKTHKLIHTGEKPYMCDICGLRVSRKSKLKLHKKAHTQERPHKCDVCGATYKQSSSLYTHKLIHTGKTPYMCDICGFQANRKDRLRLHKRVHKA